MPLRLQKQRFSVISSIGSADVPFHSIYNAIISTNAKEFIINRNFFLMVPEAGKSEIKVAENLDFCETLLADFTDTIASLCACPMEEIRELSEVSTLTTPLSPSP